MKLLNTEFAWDRNSLFQVATVSGATCLISKHIFSESISKQNVKASQLSDLLSEMIKFNLRNSSWHEDRRSKLDYSGQNY